MRLIVALAIPTAIAWMLIGPIALVIGFVGALIVGAFLSAFATPVAQPPSRRKSRWGVGLGLGVTGNGPFPFVWLSRRFRR